MDKGFSREHVQSKNRCGEEKLCFSMRSISARSGSKDVWVYFQFLKISPELNIFHTNQDCIFLTKSTSFMTFLSSLRHCIDLMTSYPYEVNDLHVLRGLAKFMTLVCLTEKVNCKGQLQQL